MCVFDVGLFWSFWTQMERAPATRAAPYHSEPPRVLRSQLSFNFLRKSHDAWSLRDLSRLQEEGIFGRKFLLEEAGVSEGVPSALRAR